MRRVVIGAVLLLGLLGAGCFSRMVSMPGESYAGPPGTPEPKRRLALTTEGLFAVVDALAR